MTRQPSTEDQLREALDSLADGVRASPDAYRKVRAEWRRRERRRRLILGILIAVVFTVTDILGLWALDHAGSAHPVIFKDPASTQHHRPSAR